ncbi:MAG: hypothetical protein J6Z50_03580 [Fibrobacterales bacterium]|nr:hypothetical protein [Fibrobacterales bacterium]MBP5188193.1 hypothetical protein [Fibrobacterales bacterium]
MASKPKSAKKSVPAKPVKKPAPSKSKSAAKKAPAKKTAPKPAAKSAKKPAPSKAKPAKKASVKKAPVKKPAPKPAAKSAKKPTPSKSKPAARKPVPAKKPAKPVSKTGAKKPAPKPAARKPVPAKKPAAKPAPKPAPKPAAKVPAKKPAPQPAKGGNAKIKPAAKPASEPKAKPAPEPKAKPEKHVKVAPPISDLPVKGQSWRIEDFVAAHRYAKATFFGVVTESDERNNKKKFGTGDQKLPEKPTIAQRGKERRGEESQEEIYNRILQECRDEQKRTEHILEHQLCSKCGVNRVDRVMADLAYCNECYALLYPNEEAGDSDPDFPEGTAPGADDEDCSI